MRRRPNTPTPASPCQPPGLLATAVPCVGQEMDLTRYVWLCQSLDKSPLLLEVLGHVGAGKRGLGSATEQGGPR